MGRVLDLGVLAPEATPDVPATPSQPHGTRRGAEPALNLHRSQGHGGSLIAGGSIATPMAQTVSHDVVISLLINF
jgi:hypothetical protein